MPTTRPDAAITAQTWLALVAMGLGVFVIAAAPAAHHRARAGPRRGRPARDRRDIVTM